MLKLKGEKINMENLTNEVMTMENTGLVVTDDMTHEQRVNLFNAVNNAEGLSDQVGKDLWLTGYIVQDVEKENEKTGETICSKLITVFDKEGKAYATNSKPFLQSLKQLKQVFNYDWTKEPVCVTIIQKKSNSSSNKYLSMAVK
ncbi:MAG: Single-stranded DNA-binding protein [Bacteriophage sp.]|nr:MAG: Single-stranded DNA-binding protein [Bacteriophage sp.]